MFSSDTTGYGEEIFNESIPSEKKIYYCDYSQVIFTEDIDNYNILLRDRSLKTEL